MSPRKLLCLYFSAQAVILVAWWTALVIWPHWIQLFQPAGWPNQVLYAFALPDFVLLASGSMFAAWAVDKEKGYAHLMVWCLAGCCWYPTLYCIGASLLSDQAWIASAMMAAMSGLTLAMATIYGNTAQAPAFIRATPMARTHAMIWTLLQILIFWSVFLWIIPKAVSELQMQLGLAFFKHTYQTALSLSAFSLASFLGLWSAFSMASEGSGTPLPTAAAPKLVIVGPYKWIRNPMATAGIIQGVAIGWLLGSTFVVVYALLGAFVWHYLVRPVEEDDLQRRFGANYELYCRQVGLWIPRINFVEN